MKILRQLLHFLIPIARILVIGFLLIQPSLLSLACAIVILYNIQLLEKRIPGKRKRALISKDDTNRYIDRLFCIIENALESIAEAMAKREIDNRSTKSLPSSPELQKPIRIRDCPETVKEKLYAEDVFDRNRPQLDDFFKELDYLNIFNKTVRESLMLECITASHKYLALQMAEGTRRETIDDYSIIQDLTFEFSRLNIHDHKQRRLGRTLAAKAARLAEIHTIEARDELESLLRRNISYPNRMLLALKMNGFSIEEISNTLGIDTQSALQRLEKLETFLEQVAALQSRDKAHFKCVELINLRLTFQATALELRKARFSL